MPVNVTIGSTITFVVEFLDNNVLTVPSSATLTITYPTDLSGGTASTAIGLTLSRQFFTGAWGTGVATLGLVDYTATAPGLTATTGQLRLIS